jgi:HK97 family phage major capsid protein
MNLNELIEKRKQVLNQLETIINRGMEEKRELRKEEDKDIENLKNEIKNIDNEIEKKNKIKNNNERMGKLNLIQEIRSIAENGKGTIILSMQERTALTAGGSSSGQEIVGEDKFSMLEPLKANLLVSKLGATIYTGLVGNGAIPVYGGTTVLWKGETTSAADGTGSTSEITLSPFRLTAYVDISKQLLLQDNMSTAKVIENDIALSVANKLENTMFSNVSGSTQPSGLFYDKSLTISGTTTWTKVNSLKSTVSTSNGLNGNLAYVTNPTGMNLLETTAKATGQGFIADMGKVGGYNAFETSNVTDISNNAGIIFGNFNDLVVAQWGDIEITVDPYTQAVDGKVRLVVNSYWDFKVRRSGSFAYGSLA